MKVDASVAPPAHLLSKPPKEPEPQRFADILNDTAKQNSGAGDAPSRVAAITPQIGDSAVSFGEKPMVSLAALEFDQPEEMFDNESNFFTWGTAFLPDAYWSGSVSSFRETIGQLAERHADFGRLAMHIPAEQMQALGKTKTNPLPPAKPPGIELAKASTPPATAQQAQGRNNAPSSGATLNEPDAPPPTKSVDRAPASRGTILANLLAVENGFRLILRTPAMRAEELTGLVERLAELFAEHGRSAPELLIYQPETPERG